MDNSEMDRTSSSSANPTDETILVSSAWRRWSARWPLYRPIGATGVQDTVVGTLGNLLVIGSLGGSVRCRNPRTVGKIFIVNLACSDLIVTSVINPMAIAGTPPRADHTADTSPHPRLMALFPGIPR